MLSKLTSRLFGSSNERQIKKYKPIIDQINNLENKLKDWQGKIEQVDDILVIGVLF